MVDSVTATDGSRLVRTSDSFFESEVGSEEEVRSVSEVRSES